MKLNLKIGAALVAVAGLMAVGANASTITVTTVTYSLEGQTLAGNVGVTTLPGVLVTLQADYAVNDLIALSVAGATVGGNTMSQLNQDTGLSTSSVNTLGIHCWRPAGAQPSPNNTLLEDAIIVSFVNIVGNQVNLRVTAKATNSAVGSICRVAGIDVTDPSLATLTTVTEYWVATIASGTLMFDQTNDGGAPAVVGPITVAATLSQFSTSWGTAAGSALTGVIDVNTGRKYFAAGTLAGVPNNVYASSIATNSDATVGVAKDLNVAALYSAPTATLDSAVFKLSGNFAHLSATATCTAAEPGITLTSVGGATVTTAVAADCKSASISDAIAVVGQTQTATFKFDGNAGRVIAAPQSFANMASITLTYHLTGSPAVTGSVAPVFSAGSWALNGFNAFTSYMPFGTGLSQIVYLTNKSNQSGAVTIFGFNDAGVAFPSTVVGTINAGSVLSLSAAVITAVQTAYGASFSGKVSFNVIANIPAGSAELYTSYRDNVNGARANVVNTSNGRVTSGGNSTTGGNL